MALSELLSQAVSAFAPRLQAEDPSVTAFLRWAARIQEHALGRFRHVMEARLPCTVKSRSGVPCVHPAIATCHICKEPCCYEHGSIAVNGTVCCLRCLATYEHVVRERISQSHQPRSEAEGRSKASGASVRGGDERNQHLKILGLKDPTDAEEIKQAFKRLALKWHPDKARSADKRAAHEEKFRKISAAYTALMQAEKS